MELRAGNMVDIRDDTKDGGYRWVEVLTRPSRQRKWSDDDKARIVEDTMQPGTVVADLARRWQVSSQQVFTWRRKMRRAAAAPLNVVPMLSPASEPMVTPACSSPAIDVELAGAVLRPCWRGRAELSGSSLMNAIS